MALSPPSSPLLSSQRLRLPTAPGVYIYKNRDGKVIYVGKAKNLKNRVSSYFRSPVQLGPKTSLLVQNIHTLEYILVNSEVEALLLEGRLIKKFKPQYNIASKDDKSPYYIHITREKFPRPVINHDTSGAVAGPFLNGLIPRRILKQLRSVAPYCIQKRPVTKPCFYSHLGLCSPCPGLDPPGLSGRKIYLKNISRLRKLLAGKFTPVLSQLKKDMALYSSQQNYEQAAITRDYLHALSALLSHPVTPDEYLVNPNLVEDIRLESVASLQAVFLQSGLNLPRLDRIEMYDNAHLSGTHSTAAMVVAQGGHPTPSLYRHFKIKYSQSNSDVGMMEEILGRRLRRKDWPYPDLIVLDGGLPQLSVVTELQKSFPEGLPVFVSLAKRLETLLIPAGNGYTEVNLPQNHPGLRLLMHLRDEAHRFSRRLHHTLRSKTIPPRS